jgi:membrane fusion protein, copper/silver efflux system
MILRKSKIFLTFLVCGFLLTGTSIAQQKSVSSQNHKNTQMKEMKMDQSKMTDSSKSNEMKNPIVRQGAIDLKELDENKDGKVYQDMMDYNVISDKPGTCPLCGMTLKEVTLKKAREILIKSGFKVKE